MDEKILINEYRCLLIGEKSEWRQMVSFGEFIWDGDYAIRLVKDDAALELPFKLNGTEVVNLVVKDQTHDANTQNDRVIVQTLTRVDRTTGNVFTYTRARCYNNGEHKWGEWTVNNTDSTSCIAIVRQTDTTVCISPNVLNVWPEMEALDITLAPPADEDIVNEYMIQFTSGEVATTLALPVDIKWNTAPTINANKIYQISIINNLAVIGEFGNE